MKRHVHLRDLAHVATPLHDEYSVAEMESARAVHVARDLRWDNALGHKRDNRLGLLSRYVDQSDYRPHESDEDVMRWEFRAELANSASRVRQGYEP